MKRAIKSRVAQNGRTGQAAGNARAEAGEERRAVEWPSPRDPDLYWRRDDYTRTHDCSWVKACQSVPAVPVAVQFLENDPGVIELVVRRVKSMHGGGLQDSEDIESIVLSLPHTLLPVVIAELRALGASYLHEHARALESMEYAWPRAGLGEPEAPDFATKGLWARQVPA